MNISEGRTVLVLWTGNSCRSQTAEAVLTHDLAGRVHAVSAGARPVDTPGFILARLAGAFAAAAAFR